ncbi:MAG: pyridoxamine 5'-phosphate oxidase family protein [Melioribacteraceae bacterium]|nr:pyridoxamine 5'-phosphate oxidase family protein [Melioribacteraceae bacterium]
MSQPSVNLDQIYKDIWDLLSIGAQKAKSDYHLGYLATSDGSNPRIRTVVLRKVLRDQKSLIIHTDYRSKKVEEIEKNPNVSILFYSKEDKIQIRLEGKASLYTEGELFEIQWEESRPLSRRCYLIQPGPGSITNEPSSGIPYDLKDRAPTEEESEPGKANFCIIKINAESIEWLNLHSSGHIRAKFIISKWKVISDWLMP